MSLFELVIGETEAQANIGELLREVEAKHGTVVVERNGEPVAAVVPIALYRQWKERREAFFERIEEVAQRANVPEDEAIDLALEAQEWARSQQ